MISLNDASKLDQGGGFEQYVFKDGVRYAFPNSKGEKTILVLPAFGTPEDPVSWIPYRNASDEFTLWIQAYQVYQKLAQKFDIISPKTFDVDAKDPIADLVSAAKNHSEFHHLAGIGDDGKFIANAYKTAWLQPARIQFIVNAMDLNDREAMNKEQSVIQIIPKTAYSGATKGKSSARWGLKSELDRKNRQAAQSEQGDFAQRFFWGDITDPRSLVPCLLRKEDSPQGGNQIYNLVPQETPSGPEGPKVIRARGNWLRSRQDLQGCFLQLELKEYLDIAFNTFEDYPELLRLAFRNKYPGIDERLRKMGAIPASVFPGTRVANAAASQEEDTIPGLAASSKTAQTSVKATSAPQSQSFEDDGVQDETLELNGAGDSEEEIPGPAGSAQTAKPAQPAAQQEAEAGSTSSIKSTADRIKSLMH